MVDYQPQAWLDLDRLDSRPQNEEVGHGPATGEGPGKPPIHAGQPPARGEETPAPLAYARLADRSLQPGRLHLRSPRGHRRLRAALAAGGADALLCRWAYRHQRPL